MKTFFALCAVVGLLLASGCMKNTYVVNGGAGTSPNYDGSFQHHVVFGLVPLSDDIDLAKVCPGGVAKIETGTSFLNGLVGSLPQNLYTPRYAEVYCANGTSQVFELEEDNQVSQVE